MSKKIFSILLPVFFCLHVSAQSGKITGKVLNEKNEALAGVSVKLVGAPGGTTTDVEGRFTLTLSPKRYSLEFSAVGYATKTVDEVDVVANQVNDLNVSLAFSGNNLTAVTVTSSRTSARRESTASLIQFQKNTNTVAAVVSAEAIRRSPDKNTGEVLKRVPGTSVQEGKYLVVRGLSDRYNQAMLNGILLSSTEPDRKTFSFDIFPAAVIDNIIINKAFVPEFPGEWAGGLVQVNTRDIPTKGFFNVQIGAGINTNTVGKDFFTYKGSNLDFLGFDNDVRALPSGIPTKAKFDALSDDAKTALGGTFVNNWGVNKTTPGPNTALQVNGGFNTTLFGKKVGGILAVTYNRNVRRYESKNSFFSIDLANRLATADFVYSTQKYAEEALWGGMGNLAIQLNNNNKISVKNLFNVNAVNYAALRTGQEFITGVDNIRARELALRTNIFYNSQINGEHNLPGLKMKFTWFGSFNILDQYVPEQRRLEYSQDASNPSLPFSARVSTGQSQKSGSIFYSNLSDYIYTAGGDITRNFQLFGNKQSVKGGYLFQVKDRLFDSRPFFIKVFDNSLKTLPEEQIFAQSNFVPGKLGFDEFVGKQFRYLANTILNAGYIQFDNLLTAKLRAVWGLRVEDYDQLIGSVKQSDSRHVHSEVTDYLPALNLTYKLNAKINIRLSGSQTVVRPEFRELSDFAFYDFELGATVLGNKQLERTKIANGDLRFEIYPRAGELFTLGVFYKYFKKPIELYFNQSGAGSSNTFNYLNADKATGYGVEFEMRKRLDFASSLKNFTFTTNVAYIYNRVKGETTQLDRPMQGQSPYVLNAGLQYDIQARGISTTLLFNEIGRRIAFVGNNQYPPIWEAPRPLLDFQVAKKLFSDRGEVKLNITDIINRKSIFYHDLDDNKKYTKGKDPVAIERKFGTTFSLSFAYNFK